MSALDPNHPEIWLDLSEIYIETGEIQKAQQVLEEGIYQQPRNASLFYRLAGLLMKQGKQKQGLALFTEGLEIDFAKHTELFDFSPELEHNIDIQELIQLYFKKKL